MIKFKYAKDENGELIHINEVDQQNRKTAKFYCFGCGHELIAKIGKIKTHHFAHKSIVSCSNETYLHITSKNLFYKYYKDSLLNNIPFLIEINEEKVCNYYENKFNICCSLPKSASKYNLAKYFDAIEIEKRENDFIPDLMLSNVNKQEKIFVEIAVTHKSTDKKLNSNYRIIEIYIENESDLEVFEQRFLSENNSKIKLINFNNKKVNNFCKGLCSVNYNFTTLDADGRYLLNQFNLNQISYFLKSSKKTIVKYKILNIKHNNFPKTFKYNLAKYAKQNFKVKNCYICRYHAENNNEIYDKGNNIFCKFLKKYNNSNEAVECNYFKHEENYIDQILEYYK